MNLSTPNKSAFDEAMSKKQILAIGALCTPETEGVARPFLLDSLKENLVHASEYLEALRLLKTFAPFFLVHIYCVCGVFSP